VPTTSKGHYLFQSAALSYPIHITIAFKPVLEPGIGKAALSDAYFNQNFQQ
jgi:hypothetical protein